MIALTCTCDIDFFYLCPIRSPFYPLSFSFILFIFRYVYLLHVHVYVRTHVRICVHMGRKFVWICRSTFAYVTYMKVHVRSKSFLLKFLKIGFAISLYLWNIDTLYFIRTFIANIINSNQKVTGASLKMENVQKWNISYCIHL